MKKLTLVIVLSLFAIFAFAQNRDGIQFDHGSWADITAKAKKAKKLIFIDCYTSWCGPCKWISINIFPLKNVGDYFNANFINYKSDMDKGEGVDLRNKFNVDAFPTLLWVDHKGNIVHRVIGAPTAEKLLADAQTAVDGGIGVGNLEKKYMRNKKNPEIVKAYLNSLIKSYDSRCTEVLRHYLSIIPKEQYLEKDVFDLISTYFVDPFSPVVTYILANRSKFDEKFTKEKVDKFINGQYRRYAYKKLAADVRQEGNEFDEASFQKLIKIMDERNVDFREELIVKTRLFVLEYKEDWNGYIAKIDSLQAAKYWKNLEWGTCMLWYRPIEFSNTKDAEVIKKAISWVDKTIELNDSFHMRYYKFYWNTKINLMERLGDEYKDEIQKLKIELNFIEYLVKRQTEHDENLKKKEAFKE